MPRPAAAFLEVIQQQLAAHMHPSCIAQRKCSLQAEKFSRIGRQEAGLCSSRVSWTHIYHPNAQGLMPSCAHTAETYQYATSASLKLHGRVLFASRDSFL
jgi:hypothetical protein